MYVNPCVGVLESLAVGHHFYGVFFTVRSKHLNVSDEQLLPGKECHKKKN